MLDAGNFKGAAEVENLREHSRREVERYAAYMRRRGFYTEAHYALGTDVVEEAARLCDEVAARFPQAQYFATGRASTHRNGFPPLAAPPLDRE